MKKFNDRLIKEKEEEKKIIQFKKEEEIEKATEVDVKKEENEGY